MTELNSKLTDEGSTESSINKINGYYTKIVGFGVSENYGELVTTRDLDSINTLWCDLPISGSVPINSTTRQLNLSIPPQVIDPSGNITGSNKNIGEVYLFAEGYGFVFTVDLESNELIVDPEFYAQTVTGKPIRFNKETSAVLPTATPINIVINKNFYIIKQETTNRVKLASSKSNALTGTALTLLTAGSGVFTLSKFYLYAIGQFSPTPLIYNYSSETKLRGQLITTNLNTFTIQFTYTQAKEIEDHNIDPNAHPNQEAAMNFNGIYTKDIDFVYKGQPYIKNVVFHSSVAEDMIVYLHSNGKYYPALSGAEGDQGKNRGIAKKAENKVIYTGTVKTSIVIDRGLDVYLSASQPGVFSENASGTRLGYSLGGGEIVFEGSGAGNGSNNIADLNGVSLTTLATYQALIIDPSGATTNFINSPLMLKYNSDVDPDLAPADKTVLIYNEEDALFKTRLLNANDLENFALATENLDKKYIINNGTSWISSDLQLPVSDENNSYTTIKALAFGNGFSITEEDNLATINFDGSDLEGLTAVKSDPLPRLGGNLDVYKGNDQVRASKTLTLLSDLTGTTFTDNGVDVNFLDEPGIEGSGIEYLAINKNGVTSYVSIAGVTDAHNLLVNNVLDLETTDTITYSIVKPRVFKITNTNTITPDQNVVIDNIQGTLGATLVTNGESFNTGGNSGDKRTFIVNATGNIELYTTFDNMVFSTLADTKIIDVNNYIFKKVSGGYSVALPNNTTLPTANQTMVISSVDSGNRIVTLGFASLGSGGMTVSNANPADLNPVKKLVYVPNSTTAKIRGIRQGNNITLQTVNTSGGITATDADITDVLVHAEMSTVYKAWGSATVYTTAAVIDGNGRQSIAQYGIRGGTGINVAFEVNSTDASKKNIVITATGSGGGGSTAIVGGSYNAGGGAGLAVSNAGNAFNASSSNNGYFATGNNYGAFYQSSADAGLGLGQNEVGVEFRADNKAQMLMIPKFPRTTGGHALSAAPALGEMNMMGVNQLVSTSQTSGIGSYNNPFGLYIYNGSSWSQVLLGQTYRTTP